MRYKLVTRDVGTNKMAIIDNLGDGNETVVFGNVNGAGNGRTITPETKNVQGVQVDPNGYAFTILNSSIAYLTSDAGVVPSGINYETSEQSMSQTVYGYSCTIKSKAILESQHGSTTSVIVTGLTYGATKAVTVTVNYLDET